MQLLYGYLKKLQLLQAKNLRGKHERNTKL